MCSFWLCESIVANPIIYRLVPRPSQFETRQWKKKHMESIAKKCINRGITHKGRCSMFPLSNEKAEMPNVRSLLGLKFHDFPWPNLWTGCLVLCCHLLPTQTSEPACRLSMTFPSFPWPIVSSCSQIVVKTIYSGYFPTLWSIKCVLVLIFFSLNWLVFWFVCCCLSFWFFFLPVHSQNVYHFSTMFHDSHFNFTTFQAWKRKL